MQSKKYYEYKIILFVSVYLFFLGILHSQTLRFYGSSDNTDELVIYDVNSNTTAVVRNFNANSIERMKFNPDDTTLHKSNTDLLIIKDLMHENLLNSFIQQTLCFSCFENNQDLVLINSYLI